MGRLGTPGEIANLIVYLASDEVTKKFRIVSLTLIKFCKFKDCLLIKHNAIEI